MDDQQASAPAASGSRAEESAALRNWQLANGVTVMDSAYEYDEVEQNEMRSAKPWQKDPHYFKEVRISAVALLKMVIHSRRGGNLEVMGLMQGRVDGNAFIIMDTFALPVEGTETRVNAQAQAYEYMSVYTDLCESEGKKKRLSAGITPILVTDVGYQELTSRRRASTNSIKSRGLPLSSILYER